eukprot:TRINITY_DN619_c0_g1_i1.p1 TRINITY_DN619_c0_g1~~TRINITY_DN619_c0_g1_i1.p1  ORF type:complete len:447 (-),score=59.87 TRINITY_DN619_c0_g1_i1:815-2155(-)
MDADELSKSGKGRGLRLDVPGIPKSNSELSCVEDAQSLCEIGNPFQDKDQFLHRYLRDLDQEVAKLLRDVIPEKVNKLKVMIQSADAFSDDHEVTREFYNFSAILTVLLHWLQARKPPYSHGSSLQAAVQEEMFKSISAGLALCFKYFSDTYGYITKAQNIPMSTPMYTYTVQQQLVGATQSPSSEPGGWLQIPTAVAWSLPWIGIGAVTALFARNSATVQRVVSASACGLLATHFLRIASKRVRQRAVPVLQNDSMECVAVAGSPSFWLARLMDHQMVAGQVRLQWLEEDETQPLDGSRRYHLGGLQWIPYSSIICRSVSVRRRGTAFVVNKESVDELQLVFEDKVRQRAGLREQRDTPGAGGDAQVPDSPSHASIIGSGAGAASQREEDLQQLVVKGEKRHLVLTMLRLYHGALTEFYTNRSHIFTYGGELITGDQATSFYLYS